MSEEVRAHLLLEAWKQTGARRTERRSYEWKIAFGMWAALLLSAQLVASRGAEVAPSIDNHGLVRVLAAVTLTLIVLAHLVYLVGVGTGYSQDLERALEYEGQLSQLIGASKPKGNARGFSPRRPLFWVSAFQWFVTLALAMLLLLLIWTVLT